MSLACLAADTAGSDQVEISSLALQCCGVHRMQDSCLVRVWAVKQSCLAEKETKAITPSTALHNADMPG